MMRYKGYVGKVEFDEDAHIFHGEVVGLRDVVTFQGRTVAQIEQAFKESVEDYLAFCRERSEPPEKPCSGRFVVRIPAELHRRVSLLARASGKSLNAWVADCLSREVTAETRVPRGGRSKIAARSVGRRPARRVAAT